MRDVFPGHYPLTTDEQERIWNTATVVLDTNVLLNPYRYSVELRERFTKILDGISSRLWIPHQVAHEFHQRRIGIIQGQHNLATELSSGFERAFNQARTKLHEYKKNALLDVDALESKLDSFYETIKKEINDSHSEALGQYALSPQDDPMLEILANLLKGHVGQPYTETELDALKVLANDRYEKSIPPGYKDVGKSGDRLYGDFFIWRQIIDHAKANDLDILLVTDDAKEDWWWRSSGVTLGPRPELREEFAVETSRIFYAYRSDKFIAEMSDRRKAPLEGGLLTEVQNASKRTEKQVLNRARARHREDFLQYATRRDREFEEILHGHAREIEVTKGKIDSLRYTAVEAREKLHRSKEAVLGSLAHITALEGQLAEARSIKDVQAEVTLTKQRDAVRRNLEQAHMEQEKIEERSARIARDIELQSDRLDMLRRDSYELTERLTRYQDELFNNGSQGTTGEPEELD